MKNFIHFITFLLLLITTNSIKSQELKLKGGQVFQDEKAIFSYDKKALNNEFHLFILNTTKTILDIQQVHRGGGETSAINNYKKLSFPTQKITIQSSMLRTRNWKFIIQLLLDEKVFDSNGVINIPNLERFADKYNEKISH